MDVLNNNLRSALEQRQAQHLYRSRQIIGSPQGAEIRIDKKKFVNFCSNDYLGLANHPDILKAFKAGADKYGIGSGASHLICGHSQAHHALEEELAGFCGRQRALLFSTGYMANLGVISALLGKHDVIFEDKLNHASMIDAAHLSGARLQRYLHRDLDNLDIKLAKTLDKDSSSLGMIASDGVFSMDGDIAPFDELAVIAKQQQCLLMIDDAHGLGVLGEQGRGTLQHLGVNNNDVPVYMGTLGKAFGTFGAFVAGSEELIETLIQLARTYIYTTALPPAIAQATRMSLSIVTEEAWRREKLQSLTAYFKQGANELGVNLLPSDTPIQPILLTSAEAALQASTQLQEQGILVSAIRAPTVTSGSERLRITLTAAHETHHVDQLLDALEKIQ